MLPNAHLNPHREGKGWNVLSQFLAHKQAFCLLPCHIIKQDCVCVTVCVSRINGKLTPHVNLSGELAQNNKSLHYVVEWLMKNLLGCPHLHCFLSHTHSLSLHTHRSTVSSLVKSTTKLWATLHHYKYNERSLAPQVHTQSAPRPAPLPPLSHTPHTHTYIQAHIHNGHSRARGPTMQFHHTKTHTSPYPVRERKEWQRWQKKNCNPWGGIDGRKWVKHKVQSVCGRSVDNILGRERPSRQANIVSCPYQLRLNNPWVNQSGQMSI